jgi:hypothetical protein
MSKCILATTPKKPSKEERVACKKAIIDAAEHGLAITHGSGKKGGPILVPCTDRVKRLCQQFGLDTVHWVLRYERINIRPFVITPLVDEFKYYTYILDGDV